MFGSVKSASSGWRPARGWQPAYSAQSARWVEVRHALPSSFTAPGRNMKPSEKFCDMPGAPPCVGNVRALGGLGDTLGFVGCRDVQAQVETLRKLASAPQLSEASRQSALAMLREFDGMNFMLSCDKYAGQLTPVIQSLQQEMAAGSQASGVTPTGGASDIGPLPSPLPSWLMPAAIGIGVVGGLWLLSKVR